MATTAGVFQVVRNLVAPTTAASYSLLPTSSDQGSSSNNAINEKRYYAEPMSVTSSTASTANAVSANGTGKDISSPNPNKEERPASRGMVVFSVLFYLVAALVMVIANKWVLNSVPVPLFFLFVQLSMAVVLLHVSAVFGYFTIPNIRLNVCKGLLPLVSINVTGLIFNTYCLQYVDASFYQVARGLVLPFTVFFSFLLLKSKTSAGALGGVFIVCIGFFLGVSAEHLHASPTGTLLGVFSSLTTSVHAIAVKRALNVVKGSTMELVYYNNLLSAALLAPLVIASGEYSAVRMMATEGGQAFQTFLIGASVTGVFGFLICIAGFLSIKVTSPVTHMISSAVRGVIQTFLGMWCFGDIITAGRGVGILFILAGSTLYTYVKDREARTKEAQIVTKQDLPDTALALSVGSGGFSSRGATLKNPSGLSINASAISLGGKCDGLSPTTPKMHIFGPDQQEMQHTPSLRSVSSPLLSSTAIPRDPLSARRASALAPISLSTQAAIDNRAHAKAFSATDLRDILVAPSERHKDAKVY